MLNQIMCCALVLLCVACGKGGSQNTYAEPVQLPTQPARPPATATPPAVVSRDDFAQISNLLPTMYYVPQEKNVSCKGKYGGQTFNGTERMNLRDMAGVVLANVCTRFYKFAQMEGSAILSNRGEGEVAINFAGRVAGEIRFHAVDRCVFGEGVKKDLCLLPYHTIAADNTVHKIGDIIYVPKADGLRLPDGSIHEGFFIVRDTGGAFNGIGSQRVDLFTGIDPDYDNAFLKAGFNHTTPMSAFKIRGKSAEVIKLRLKDKFDDLY